MHLRIVAESSPGPDAELVNPTLEEAYLHLISMDNNQVRKEKDL
jgi:hypothetical protein